jgi:hypothetical protein
MNQNGRSRSAGIIGHHAPEYPHSKQNCRFFHFLTIGTFDIFVKSRFVVGQAQQVRLNTYLCPMSQLMTIKTNVNLNSPQLLCMSARKADEILDHLSIAVSMTSRGEGRIERIQGMGLQYWTDRINAVIDETDRFSSQQERAKRLLIRLRSSDRA